MKCTKNIITILLIGIVVILFFVNIPLKASAETITINTPIGYLDNPVSGSTQKGTLSVKGWFLNESGVETVDVLVDGSVVGQAIYGDARPDVLQVFPQFNNGSAGFHYDLDTIKITNGQHTVSIKVTDKNGQVTNLPNRTITINNENPIGDLNNPTNGVTVKGNLNVSGWFLDLSGVEKIDVLVDGSVVGQAIYGDARPDVLQVFPQFNNGSAGFHYDFDTTQFSDGQHTITIKVTGKNGRVTTLANRSIMIKNTIWFLDNPVYGSSYKGNLKVRGWFLDEIGVETIDVLVDGALVGQAVYGDARPDVQQVFPQFNNGTAGFHYDLDTTRITNGQHTITIRVNGKNNRITTLPNRTITIKNENPIGDLNNPGTGSTQKGTLNVRGWFLDLSGVEKVDVLVDGATVGQAFYGDPRPDVQKVFPQFNNGSAGFHYYLDTTQFSEGQHIVTIMATGKNGHITTLPNSTIMINNTEWYLDNPVSGSTLKGTLNVTGWFLDESGVETVDVLVDGLVVGQGVYGDARPDVQQVFPQFNNGTAGFHYAFDTTQFSDGQHSVTIKVTGKTGPITTLPNRTITIKNDNSIGDLNSPVSGRTYRGTQTVRGWFLNQSGVEIIEVLVDGAVVGQAVYGDARPDVLQVFPQFNNGTAGFHYDLDTTLFSVGKHTVTIRIKGKNGRVLTLPSSTVTFNQSKTVFLDPGHGGSDSGATAGGYYEADLNLAVAKKVQALLLERGYIVNMSRNNKDTTVSLLDRSKMANDINPDIFISLHHNSTAGGATSANGIESYYYEYDAEYPSKINGDLHNNPERISKSKTLTNLIHENLLEYTGANDRGTAGETFSVLRETAVPATLIELGFINNSSERQNLILDSYQSKLALAIADGIDEYFNIY